MQKKDAYNDVFQNHQDKFDDQRKKILHKHGFENYKAF